MPIPRMKRNPISHQMPGDNADATAPAASTSTSTPYIRLRPIDGLSLVAKEVMQMDPMSGAMFVFINARRNKLKLLVWERNGFMFGTSVWSDTDFTGHGAVRRRC